MNRSERQRKQATAGTDRLLALVRNNPDECPLHVSAVLQHIRDDGPALIDGREVELSARNAATWRKRRHELVPDAEVPAASATLLPPCLPAASAPFPLNIWLRGLLMTVLVITMTLSITAIFSWG